jgi:hypothetical protein
MQEEESLRKELEEDEKAMEREEQFMKVGLGRVGSVSSFSSLLISDLISLASLSSLVLSCPVLSWRVLHLSCRVVSCRVVSCRVVSCRVVSCRVMSCRVSCICPLINEKEAEEAMKLAQLHAQLVIEQERLAMESKGKIAEDKMNEAIEKERRAEAKVLCVCVCPNMQYVICACKAHSNRMVFSFLQIAQAQQLMGHALVMAEQTERDLKVVYHP